MAKAYRVPPSYWLDEMDEMLRFTFDREILVIGSEQEEYERARERNRQGKKG